MNITRILVPTDFSPPSDKALACGLALAGAFDAAIHLLHVVEVAAGAEALTVHYESQLLVKDVERMAWEELQRLMPQADQKRARAELDVESGSPLDEILRYAREHAIDLIVMGTHGRTGLSHLIIGSVAEHVVRSAPCPVMTVRHAADA